MGRAKKIDEDTWHYRGLRITRHERRWFSVGHIGTQPWSSFMDAFTLKECVQRIDERFEWAQKKAVEAAEDCERGESTPADPDAVENVTLTVSLNQARTILAALNRRFCELESLGGEQASDQAAETKAAYLTVDRQAFPANS